MRGVIPDIMTVDTEGSDALVLLGAAKTLASGRVGYLEFEYHAIGPWARRALSDVIAYLDNLAFDCWWAGQGQTFRITGAQRVQTPSSLVTLDVRENHGHSDFTCVFRFRVHSHDLD